MNYYLDKEDIELIDDYKAKNVEKIYEKINEIIVKRLNEKFKDNIGNEKFEFIKKLIKVCVSLDKEDYNANSLII